MAATQYITTEEFAALVRTSPSTARYWRHRRTGPPSFRVGRRVLYDLRDVERWIELERERQAR